MGLKSGSRDAELDESEESADGSVDREAIPSDESKRAVDDAERSDEPEDDQTESDQPDSEEGVQRPTMSSIPYKLRRDKVNEGREQVPYFLRDEIIEAEDELQTTLEEILGEDVYKSDYREAAMVVAQQNPELVAEVLREWGYDLDTV